MRVKIYLSFFCLFFLGTLSLLTTDTKAFTPQVAAGYGHTVGLKSDGTVIAEGSNFYGACEVNDWTDIIQVAAGVYHTVGLRKNGTVIAVG